MEEDHTSLGIDRKEVYWTAATFLTAVIITGLVFRFDYTDDVQIHLHYAYFVLAPFHFTLLFWTVLTFLVFLAGSFKDRFTNLSGLYVLLGTNSILTAVTMTFGFMSYSFFSKAAGVGPSYGSAMMFWGVLLSCFTLTEILVVRRVLQLRKNKV